MPHDDLSSYSSASQSQPDVPTADEPFDASPDALARADGDAGANNAGIPSDANTPLSIELDGGSDETTLDAGDPSPSDAASSSASTLDSGTPDAAAARAPRAARAPLIEKRPDQERPDQERPDQKRPQ